MKIIHTDNTGGDYPDEKFVTELPRMSRTNAEFVAQAINFANLNVDRYYRAVEDDYVLSGGLEP